MWVIFQIVSENCVTIIKEQFDFEKIIIIIIDLFFDLRGRFPSLPWDSLLYHNDPAAHQDHCGLWEKPDMNPGPLPQKSGAQPMSHHISIEPSHLQRAITSPMSHHIFNVPPHLQWATTSWENYNVFISHKNLIWLETFHIKFKICKIKKWNIPTQRRRKEGEFH